jgi:hypothetical protein
MRGSIVEEDVASGTRIFRVPRLPISGARSFMDDILLEKFRAHDLVMYRASRPLNPG